MDICCPKCNSAIRLVDDTFVDGLTCPSCNSHIHANDVIEICVSEAETLSIDIDEQFAPEPNDIIGRFRIDYEVGRGGFGSVYKAYDTRLGRPVALKIPRSTKFNRRLADSFLREAKAAAKLRDNNIVAVHEIGRDHGRIYIVSDYIDGETLTIWRNTVKPCQVQSAKMISKLARAMHTVHKAGIVHRDLKPGNIIVDRNEQPYITDFGLAKNDELGEIVAEGKVIGTPAYMSPEQASGNGVDVDCRTDIYSLGVILYELLTRKRPFEGKSSVLIDRVKKGEKLAPSQIANGIDRELETICLKAMKIESEERFGSALDFSDHLDAFIDRIEQPVTPRPKKVAAKTNGIQVSAIMAACIGFVIFLGMLPSITAPNTSGPEFVPSPKFKQVFLDVLSPGGKSVTHELTSMTLLWHPDYIVYGIVKPILFDVYPANREGGVFDILLQPGEYTVVVEHPKYGSFEVRRRVPATHQQVAMEGIRCQSWSRKLNGAIVLPTVEFVEHEVLADGGIRLSDGQQLVQIGEGDFFSGYEGPGVYFKTAYGKPQLPLTRTHMARYHIGKHEVTVGQFRKVMEYVPPGMKMRYIDEIPSEIPVSNVTYPEAVEYCERVGGRLPTFDEFVFAGTNGGENNFPWGDDERFLEESWEVGNAGASNYDRTSHLNAVKGMCSNVVEWTCDTFVPDSRLTKDSSDILPIETLHASLFDRKVVVGGDNNVRKGKFNGVNSIGTIRCFLDIYRTQNPGNGQGFRVAK